MRRIQGASSTSVPSFSSRKRDHTIGATLFEHPIVSDGSSGFPMGSPIGRECNLLDTAFGCPREAKASAPVAHPWMSTVTPIWSSVSDTAS